MLKFAEKTSVLVSEIENMNFTGQQKALESIQRECEKKEDFV